MTNGHVKRGRFDLALPQARWRTSMASMKRSEFWMRVGLCIAAIAAMWLLTGGWNPPFVFREGYIPPREICARVPFEFLNEQATIQAKVEAKQSAITYYSNDPQLLENLPGTLKDQLFKILGAESYTPEAAEVWKEFFVETSPAPTGAKGPTPKPEVANEESFMQFRESLAQDANLERLTYALEIAMMEFRRTGLLKNLQHKFDEGSTTELMVFPKGNPSDAKRVDVDAVRISVVGDQLLPRLKEQLKRESDVIDNPEEVAQRVYSWLRPQLIETLTRNKEATEKSQVDAAKAVEKIFTEYAKGEKLTYLTDPTSENALSDTEGIGGGKPLDVSELEILKAEHRAYLKQRPMSAIVAHILADLGLYCAVFLLAGCYLAYREPMLIENFRKFSIVLGCLTATVIIAFWVSPWRTEIIPVMFFAMAISIAWRHDVAWVLSSVVSMICAFALGVGLTGFIVLIAGATTASFLTGTVRNRTKLVYVGIFAALIVVPTALGASVLNGQPMSVALLLEATWFGLCAFLAGLLMTALLPFVEKLFGVHTDISLLELGDATHPLLQELVRRAPGTYNHSINVASISEAAADMIGANGLLCRVAAYFHDIGKMRKPEYFVENQGGEGNKHDQLVPAMSTLVIIAHVKDGVELARQNHLPQIIIDFIEQHHGTTLVEYFYRQATQESEEREDGSEVDEANFRYPGPKPQTREACVMMMADAVESASRTLVDPAPSRIENLVHDIMLKRLHDGQFDECGITLKELNLIEESLVKSITATYHSRVKYPEQKESGNKPDKKSDNRGAEEPKQESVR